jgi:diguanylate cyclase (GGDEF)-like protein
MTNNGYVYVIDSNGVTLSHPNSDVIGTNRFDLQNEQGEFFIRDIINAAQNNKGFVEYHSSFLPENLTSSAKQSYVKYLSDWGWTIGTGFYKQELNSIINDQKQLLERQNSIQTAKVVSFTIFVTLLFGLLSLILAKKLTLRFERYQHRIALDFQSLSKLKDKLEFSAHHDSLTDLPNRKLFEQTVNHYLKHGRQNNKRVAIMFVDLDNFKKINDLHGHAVGDTLLTHVSNQFMSVLGHQDTVSRFGGDEFVFCFPNLDSIEAAEKKAHTVINSLKDSCALSGKIISTGCSAGLAVYPDHGTSIDKLLSNADMALYRTKDIDKGNYLLFDNHLSESQEYDQELEKHLAAALQNREISVHYQPQIDFKTGKMFGIEALARWHNPKLGHVPPSIFIAKAEEIGIINDLGDFIIKQACKEIVSVFPNGLSETNLSINITPSRIKDATFVDTFTDLIDDSGLSRHRVTLEITENVLIDDLESVAPALTQLRFRQFSIALDDFGTGFSSLGYLNQLPINEIKIDRSFVEKLPHNKQSQSLVNAIMAISSSMNLRVVAEGIETPEQSQWLEKSGCEIAQGYLFAKPMPLSQLEKQYSAIKTPKQALMY